MKEYIMDYIKEIDDLLNNSKKISNDVIEKHLIKINFFQHERLIHLLVTLFYALFFMIFIGFGFVHFIFYLVAIVLSIFLLFYVVHYFRLENGVQYMYKQYDHMLSKKKDNSLWNKFKKNTSD